MIFAGIGGMEWFFFGGGCFLTMRQTITYWNRLGGETWAGTSENQAVKFGVHLFLSMLTYRKGILGGGFCIDRIRASVQIITRDKGVFRSRDDTFCIQSRLRGKGMVVGVLSGLFPSPSAYCTTGIVGAELQNSSQPTVLLLPTMLSQRPSSVHSCASYPESWTHVNPTPAQSHLSMDTPRQRSQVTQRQNHELDVLSCLKNAVRDCDPFPQIKVTWSPARVSARRPAFSYMMVFALSHVRVHAASAGMRYFCTRTCFSFCLFSFFSPFPRCLSTAPGSLTSKGVERTLYDSCPVYRRPQQHYFIVLLLASLFFFSLVTHPANAMRQLFQTTISLCGQGCGSTHLFLCGCVLFLLPFLWSPLSRALSSSWEPGISCATELTHMPARVHTYVHGARRGTRQRDLCFSTSSFLFLSPSLPPSCISTRLPFPGSWGGEVAGDKPPPFPPGTLTPVSCLLPYIQTYRVVRCPPPSSLPTPVAGRLGPGHTVGDLVVELGTRRRRRQQQGGRTGPDAIFRRKPHGYLRLLRDAAGDAWGEVRACAFDLPVAVHV